MRKQEKINLIRYLLQVDNRLESTLNDCEMRFVRRELDSVDLLEEIIAKENLKLFRAITNDILHIFNLQDGE